MKKPGNVKTIIGLISMMLLFCFLPVMQSDVYAASVNTTVRDAQQEDAYTDDNLSLGYAYPVSDRESFTNSLTTGTILVNYVGGNLVNFGLNYQRSAIKLDITGISGTITSAQLKIHVVDAVNNPVVNLISTTDNSWSQIDQKFPAFNSTKIINGYANSPVSANSDMAFNVTDYLQSVVDTGASSVSFVLTGTEGGNQFFNFVSNLETTQTSFRPILELTYITPASPPSVTGAGLTNNTMPTWSWTAGGGGNGTFRYRLDNDDLTSGATTTTSLSYTPGSALPEGSHTLYVQESNGASPVRWSNSGSFTINIDTTPPGTSAVTGTTPTNSVTPTWTWSSGGGGNGNYRYKLDASDLSTGATATTSTSYTPSSALGEGAHTLYVQERDGAGNWSSSGSFTINIDTTPPGAPAVIGTTPTNSVTPTWTWTPGGGGNGNYRYKLDDSDLAMGATATASTSYTPGSALGEGAHTLYVQESDDAGNWSASGSFLISVTTSEALTVSNPSTTGFTVALTPSLSGLTAANFTLFDRTNSPVTITGATTSDNGATYVISAALSAGETYTVTATDTGYTFGTAQSVIVPLVKYQGTQKRFNTDGTYDIRCLATIDTLDADSVGFVFSKAETMPTKENVPSSQVVSTTTVYRSVTAGGSPVMAASLGGTYIIACTVKAIPATDINTPLYIRAFSSRGAETIYTDVKTVTVSSLH